MADIPVDGRTPASKDRTVAMEAGSAIGDGEEGEKKNARPERTADFQDYLRVFSYANAWDFAAYGAGVAASIGSGVTVPLMNVVFVRFSLYIFILFLARWLLGTINKFAFRMIGIRISSAIRLHYLQRLFGQSIHVLDSMPPGYAVSTITTTSNTLQLGISEKLGTFIEYTSLIIAGFIVAFARSWELTLVTFSGTVFMLLVVSLLLPVIIKGHSRVTEADGRAGAIASEALASIRMIMACGAEARTSKRYSAFVAESKKHSLFTSPFMATQFSLVFFGAFASFGLAFWYGTRAYTRGRLDNVGDIVVVLISIMMIVFSLERVSTPLLAVSKATVAACEFFTVIDAPQPNQGHLREPEVSATDDIVLSNVTFAYPSRPHLKILDNLDLHIEAGKITAIVGSSGSGKSTVVGLIERWYTLRNQYTIAKTTEKGKTKSDKKDDFDDEVEPVNLHEDEDNGPAVELSGSIQISGRNLDAIDLKWWRSKIGLVQQEPFLFNESIYSNVSKGLVGSEWENEPEERKRELVKEACIEAFADEFIDRLSDKYDTMVGDGGAKLSGGQRQRIAIARSIVRKPQILILDEATSAIDVRGERVVQAALDRAAKGRTTITIAHRLSTIKKADRIVVMKKGKLAESGDHESLVAAQGIYYGLVQAQNLSMGDEAEADEKTAPETTDDDSSLTREKTHNALSEAADEQQEDKTSPDKNRSLFRSFGRFFYESRDIWLLSGLAILASAGAGAANPLQAWLLAQSINAFQHRAAPNKLMDEGEFWALMWTMLAIGVGVAYFFTFLTSLRLSGITRAKYQQEYFDSILFQKAAYFDDEDHSHGTVTARLAGDPKQLEELMGANMAMVYIAMFNIAGSIAIALSFTWKLALVSICVVLPATMLASFFRFRYELQFEQMNSQVFAESSRFASESIGAMRTVTALTLETSITERFDALCRGHVAHAYRKARWVSILFGFADSTTMACQSLIFYYGSRLLLHGEITLVDFFVCLMAIMNAGQSAGQGLSFGPNAAQVTAAANRILNARESRLSDAMTDRHAIEDASGGMKIELRNVRFRYPARGTPVFDGLSLTIERGQFAALVGASGCGKTSTVSLLERFYDVDGGQILADGRDISELNVHAYRKHLALVAQEATLFQGTLRDNILLGVDPEAVTDDQLHDACRDASIHDFIVSLPEGYSTNIGSRGVSLSGGQKQRIAIARALIRRPNVMLLDEATSSLDSESERLVQSAFERASHGRTMIVVAHRLATVQNADVIFVLGDGKLLEKGNHAELLRKRGIYHQMCQSQALDR
ncbi:ABC-type multidrug transport system, ATPase and permease component [Geosmithia morbida]|uniref:ABC-type multidrug transport system, ATPase and permease component n=1 Tax=Geosmithia morbida TaxID=1094350 RepID=A0A9P4YVC5_9HYPO|nr:ABC-type multidrug transport system, ATPase and permease component [Geosmithia morbida]KAF4123510.1 ABC-type multidrug transport system, ATPase and permease component [Geosmithia morbida]